MMWKNNDKIIIDNFTKEHLKVLKKNTYDWLENISIYKQILKCNIL